MSNTRLIYFIYLIPLFMTFVLLPTQIQGQSITDETTGASTSNTTSGAEDRDIDLNCTPGYPCIIPEDEATGSSTSNTTSGGGDRDIDLNCTPGYPCIIPGDEAPAAPES
jgi:hypothetical protein